MRKRILLMLAIMAMLVFAMSICASAAVTGSSSNEYGTLTVLEGMESKDKYSDTTSRAVLKNADGTFTTYPAYYIYNSSTGTNMRLDFALLNEKTGESYTSSSLIRVEVFEDARLNWTYQNCSSLIDVYMPDSVYLHYASFTGCSSLTEIVIPKGTGTTQIPTDCFSGCTSLEKVEISSNITALGMRAFQNCNALAEIRIPEKFASVIPQDFRKITNGKTTVPCTYIVPATCTGVNSRYSVDNCNVSKIIFTGKETDAFVADLTTDGCSWAVSIIEYKNHCDVYYDGVHQIVGSNDCTDDGDCDRCKVEGIVKGFADHNYVETMDYANGFTNKGVYSKVCANLATCTCGNVTGAEKNAIFSASSENGFASNGTGIAFGGYTVNTDALKEFNDLSANDITYGVVIMNPKYVGDTFFTDGSVNASKGFIVADMSASEYSNIKVMIDGLGANKSLELVIALYAYTDSADVEFIQSEDTESACSSVEKTDATLYTVSLTSVVDKPNTGLDMLPPYNKENA